jgi:hypothetical protein
MPKLKPGTILPTPDEDASLTAAAKADADARPYSDAEWRAAKPLIRAGSQTCVDEAMHERVETHKPI